MPSCNIVDRIRQNLMQGRDRPAVVMSSFTWTYERLAKEVTRIECLLSGLRGRPVFVEQARTPTAIATYAAALLSKNYTVFVPPNCDCQRRARIMNTYPKGVSIDDFLNVMPAGTGPEMDHIDASAAGYSIFTSGSTGTPKGAMISRDNLSAFINDIAALYDITFDDRVLAFADFGFDVTLYEIYVALSTGAALCLIDDTEKQDPATIQRFLEETGVTTAEIPPALLPFLNPDALPELRLLSVGGEQINQEQVDRWVASTRVFNGYGPAECTVAFTQHAFRAGDPANLIGRVVGDNRSILLDLNTGVAITSDGVGELCVSGSYVGLGYTNSPFETVYHEGRTYYRTGDVVSVENGRHFIHGRIDDIVKRYGVRISLREIDATILEVEAISNAHSVYSEGMILSFVTGSEPIDVKPVHRQVAAILGKERAPNQVIWMEYFPLTANGKVDAQTLLHTFGSQSHQVTDDADGSEMSEQVVKVVSDVLRKSVSTDENLFELGAQSIDILRMLHRIEIEFDQQVPYMVFAQNPTIEGLICFLESEEVPSEDLELLVTVQTAGKSNYIERYLKGLHESGKTAAAYFLDRTIDLVGDRSFCDVCTILEYCGAPETLDGCIRIIEQAFADWAERPYLFLGTATAEVESSILKRAHLTCAFAKLIPQQVDGQDVHKFGVVKACDRIYLILMHTHTDVDGYALGRFLEILEDKWCMVTTGAQQAPVPNRKLALSQSIEQPCLDPVEIGKLYDQLFSELELKLAAGKTSQATDKCAPAFSHEFTIEEDVFRALSDRAASKRVSPAALLLCLTKDWLSETVVDSPVPFWVPVDGRSSLALHRQNCVAGILPLSLEVHDTAEVAHRALLGLKAYETVPPELVVDRIASISPEGRICIPNLFAFQNCGDYELEDSDMNLRHFETLHSAPIFVYYRTVLRGLNNSVCFSTTRTFLHCRIEYVEAGGLNASKAAEFENRIIEATELTNG